MKNYTIKISGSGTMDEAIKELDEIVKALKALKKIGEPDNVFFEVKKLTTEMNETKLKFK